MRIFVYIFLIISLLLASTLLLCGCSFDGETEMIKHTYSISEDIKSIDVLVKKADFSVSITTDDIETAKLELIYSKKAISDYSVSDGTLSVTAKRNFPLNIFNGEEGKIILTLPKKDYKTLSINSSSGDITLKEISFTGSVKIDATSSDVEFSGVAAYSLICDITSGDFDAENCSVVKEITHKSTSGEVNADKISAESLEIDLTSGDADIKNSVFTSLLAKSTSGDIELNGVTVTKEASLDLNSGCVDIDSSTFGSFKSESTSGNLVMKNSDAGELDISSTSGDITLTLLTPKNFVVETTSGKQDVIGTVYTQPLCKINTTSGDVTVRIAE